MTSIEPILIICDEPIIHKPKPKRIYKTKNNISYIDSEHFSNRLFNPCKMTRKHNNEKRNKNNNKASDKISFNLDLISLEEIENDFNVIKSKDEEFEVQKELLNLLRNTNNNYKKENCHNNFGKFKRPKNPDYKNFELIL